MSEWKSRVDIEPPAQFFADALAYLSLAFPGARLDREMVRELRPYLVHQWRLGQNGAKAAAATCSCDGVKIVPSPASQIEIPKRSALAPKGAQRTDVFGVEDLRTPLVLPGPGEYFGAYGIGPDDMGWEPARLRREAALLQDLNGDGAQEREFTGMIDVGRADHPYARDQRKAEVARDRGRERVEDARIVRRGQTGLGG